MPCRNDRGNISSDCSCRSPEKVCIQVKRVFDACISQFILENVVFIVDFPRPVVSFVSARSVGKCKVSNVVITPLPGKTARVQFTVTIPLQVIALDAQGGTVIGTTSLTVNRDIILKVPKESLVPIEVECIANVVGVDGRLSNNTLTMTCCVTLISKIVAEVELLIHTCGYPALPACQEFTEDVCEGVFNLPIYPR